MSFPYTARRPAARLGAGVLAMLLCAPLAGAVTSPVGAVGAPAAAAAVAPDLPEVALRVDPGQETAARSAPGSRPVRSRTLRLQRRDWESPGAWLVRGWRTDGYAQVGATWRGAGDPRLQARTRADDGAWGRWRVLEVMGDGPETSSDEGRDGLRASDLWWAGRSRDLQVRARGARYRDLRVVLIDPGAEPDDARPTPRPAAGERASGRADARGTSARPKPAWAPRPPMFSRRTWGANENWRDSAPSYIDRLHQVHVHHTVNSNDYRRQDVAPMIRGIYRYHTLTLGWSDVGYNFLVDRFGRAWAGRAGGVGRLVRGAHTLGFNETGTGISVIGNFEEVRVPRAARWMVAQLAAWKLDKAGLQPSKWRRVWSHGSDLYRTGRHPKLPRIAGHRDTNQTACPGRYLYEKLHGIRAAAQRRANNFG